MHNAQCTMHNAQLRRAAANGFGGICLLREQGKPPSEGVWGRAESPQQARMGINPPKADTITVNYYLLTVNCEQSSPNSNLY